MDDTVFAVTRSLVNANSEQGSLYRAYRSLTFAEVVGQVAVTRTLRNAVRYDRVAHAYLFTGPRGTGKTSTARILARAVNCLEPRDGEPCNACTVCLSMLDRRSLDLVEIDGASNNSVDDVRELRERVNLRPAEGKRKVFIIDEVHMLSIGAFNALLKTLEEPPDHILFALATTEAHKVPATVRSRCQLLELRPIPLSDMVDRLQYVCDRESLHAAEGVLQFLAAQSTGSLRDALSLLEQVRAFCGATLNLHEVEAALGVARATQVEAQASAMAGGGLAAALGHASELMESGVDPRQLSRQLTGFWRDALVARARQQPLPSATLARCRADQIVPVLYSLLSVESTNRRSDSPRWALETAIAEATLKMAAEFGIRADNTQVATARQDAPNNDFIAVQVDGRRPAMANNSPVAITRVHSPISAAASEPAHADLDANASTRLSRPEVLIAHDSTIAPTFDAAAAVSLNDESALVGSDPSVSGGDEVVASASVAGSATAAPLDVPIRQLWPRVMRQLSEDRKPKLYGLLQKVSSMSITVDAEYIYIPFSPSDKFVRSQLEQPANRKVLEDTIAVVFGGRRIVRCVTIETPQAEVEGANDADYLDSIAAEAFGHIGNAGKGV